MIPYPDIDPIAFQIGPVAVRWYGISYVLGIGCMWWLLDFRARRSGGRWSTDSVADLVFYVALGGILGGRFGYVLFYSPSSYLEHPLSIFMVWQGGMSFHGGLLGVLAAVYLFARRDGRRFFAVSDFLAPGVPIGLMFGRLGNFANRELWGAPTELPWGMVFPDPSAGGIPRHPSQLYEAALEGLLLFVILWLISNRPRPEKTISGLFLVGYALARIAVEFVRVPDAHIGYLGGGWLTMGQALSAPMIIFGLWLLIAAQREADSETRSAH